jgi:hypothetical protein
MNATLQCAQQLRGLSSDGKDSVFTGIDPSLEQHNTSY